jgi:hypothetical protein
MRVCEGREGEVHEFLCRLATSCMLGSGCGASDVDGGPKDLEPEPALPSGRKTTRASSSCRSGTDPGTCSPGDAGAETPKSRGGNMEE